MMPIHPFNVVLMMVRINSVYEFFPTKMTYYERKLGAVVARAPDTINK